MILILHPSYGTPSYPLEAPIVPSILKLREDDSRRSDGMVLETHQRHVLDLACRSVSCFLYSLSPTPKLGSWTLVVVVAVEFVCFN